MDLAAKLPRNIMQVCPSHGAHTCVIMACAPHRACSARCSQIGHKGGDAISWQNPKRVAHAWFITENAMVFIAADIEWNTNNIGILALADEVR